MQARGARGISIFLVDTTLPGFVKGKKLDKVGCQRLLRQGDASSRIKPGEGGRGWGDIKRAGALVTLPDCAERFLRFVNLLADHAQVGYKAQDTSELFFEDLRVPHSAIIGGALPLLRRTAGHKGGWF